MTRLVLRYVHRFRDRHGHVRHYFRRPGFARLALPGLPGSAEFMAVYQAALAGAPLAIGSGRTKPGTLSALAVAYYGSSEFYSLAKVTQATYRNITERLRIEHGDKPVAGLKREHVRRLVAAKAETPASANALLKILRILMRFAIDDGWRVEDPTLGVRRVRYQTEGFRPWSDDDIAVFQRHHADNLRARLALALLLYTGQRPGDVTRMGRQHVRDGRIDVRQQKTGTRLSIPIHRELEATLAELGKGDHLTFLLTRPGAPFTPAGFSQWFGECARAAGVSDGCTAHGLRKAAARRLAEAGCTAHQIASITGHKTLREVERYTRDVDQMRMAYDAIGSISPAKAAEK